MRFHLVDNIFKEYFHGFIAKARVIFRYFIEAFLEDKIPGVANLIVSNRNNPPPPVPVRRCLLISDNLVNNRFSLVYGFNTQPTEIEIGEFIVSGDSRIPVICGGPSEGIGSNIMGRNVSNQFRRFSINVCVNAAKIEGAVTQKDDIGWCRRGPRLICMFQKRLNSLRTHATIPKGVVDIIGRNNFRAISSPTRSCAPRCQALCGG